MSRRRPNASAFDIADHSVARRKEADLSIEARAIWYDVIAQAVDDARSGHRKLEKAALEWIDSDSTERGSLRWIISGTPCPVSVETVRREARRKPNRLRLA